VNPLIVRYDGSRHKDDGMPAYGVGQVSKDGRVFLVACVAAAGDAMYGQLAAVNDGRQYGAAHLTATVNVLISVCTNGELVEYDDEKRCAFVANRAVKADTVREAAKNMMSGEYVQARAAKRTLANKKIHAKKDEDGKSVTAMKSNATRHAVKDEDGKSVTAMKSAATRNAVKDEDGKSVAGKKSAATRNAVKDEDGKSVAAMKSNATRHAVKDEDGKSVAGKKSAATRNAVNGAAGKLQYVYKRKDKDSKKPYFYQKYGETCKGICKSGFDSELAAAVALNDQLASRSLPPDNEGWFNAEEERRKEWKEEWKGVKRVQDYQCRRQ
jgi:hypothetical protein